LEKFSRLNDLIDFMRWCVFRKKKQNKTNQLEKTGCTRKVGKISLSLLVCLVGSGPVCE
jgi:hypothetical protein